MVTAREIAAVGRVLEQRVRHSARIAKVLRRERARLMKKHGLVALGVGIKKRRGKRMPGVAAIFFVKRKLPRSQVRPVDRLPAYILVRGARVPTDVVTFRRFKDMGRQFDKYRPVQMGCSIAPCPPMQPPPSLGWGTAGAVVIDDPMRQDHFILTAAHVLQDNKMDVIQPFWGQNRDDPSKIPLGQAPNPHDNIGGNTRCAGGGVDAGVFEANFGTAAVIGLGAPTDMLPPIVGLPVRKSGASTEVTDGYVDSDFVSVSRAACPDAKPIVYQSAKPPVGPPPPDAEFLEGCFIVHDMVHAGGDSGSLFMAGPEQDLIEFVEMLAPGYPKRKYSHDLAKSVAKMLLNNAVGLLIRGDDVTTCFGVDIVTATAALRVQLDGVTVSGFNAKLIQAMKG